MEFIRQALDPFNLAGLAPDPTKDAYYKAVEEYKVEYYRAQKKGIPLDLLGYNPPKAIVKTAMFPGKFPGKFPTGLGGGTKGLLPTEVPILNASGSLPQSALTEIRESVASLRGINDSAGTFNESKTTSEDHKAIFDDSRYLDTEHDIESEGGDRHDRIFEEEESKRVASLPPSPVRPEYRRIRPEYLRSVDFFDTMLDVEGEDEPMAFGARPERRLPESADESEYTPEYFEEKDNPTPEPPSGPITEQIFLDKNRKNKAFDAKVAKAEAAGRTVVTSAALRSVLEKLGNNSNAIIKGSKNISSTDQKELFGSLLTNETLQNKLLQILNANGVSLIGKAQKDGTAIVKELLKNSGPQLAAMYNDIIREFAKATYDPKKLAKLQENFPTVDLTNLKTEDPPLDEATFIPHIPNIHQNITDIIAANGVDRGIAGRFTSQLLSTMANLSALKIASEGSITSGRTQAADYMGSLVEELQSALKKLYGRTNINLRNVGQQILSTIFERKEALKEIGGMKLAEKIDVFRQLMKQFTTQAPQVPLSGWSDIEGKVNRQVVNANMQNLLGFATGNDALNASPTQIASFLRNTSNQRDIIQRGGFRIHDNPDPSTPIAQDPRRSATVTVETPDGRIRRFDRKNFIKALVLIGVPAGIISAIITAVTTNKPINNFIIPADPGKNTDQRDYGIDNVTREATIKANITKVDQPLKKNVDLSQITNFDDFANIDALSKPGSKLTPLKMNRELAELGLTDRVDLYNQYVEQFNQASAAKDNFDKSHWQSKAMNLKRIMEGVINQQRGDPAVTLGKEFAVNLPDLNTRHDNKGLFNGYSKLKPLILNDIMIKEGKAPMVNRYNYLIDMYNESIDNQVVPNIKHWEGELNKLISESRVSRSTGVSAYTDAQLSDQSEKNTATLDEIESVKAQLLTAIKDKKSEYEISSIHKKYTELLSKSRAERDFSDVTSHPRTYLKDVIKEQFPQTREETVLFRKLQDSERQLAEFVNPADKLNNALTEYENFTGQLEKFADPAATYNARLAKLDEIYTKYKVPKAGSSATTMDDEFSTISDVVERPDASTLQTDARPDFQVGGEALVLTPTPEERLQADMAWQQYSVVEPGFGNGPTNPLYLDNLESDKIRFRNLPEPVRWEDPSYYPGPQPDEQARPKSIYGGQSQPYDEFNNTVFQPTPEFINDVKRSTFENDYSIYFPERNLARFKSKPVRIPRIREDGQRFAPASYRYGESIDKLNWGVQNESVPYPNAKGFPQVRQIPGWAYNLVRKR